MLTVEDNLMTSSYIQKRTIPRHESLVAFRGKQHLVPLIQYIVFALLLGSVSGCSNAGRVLFSGPVDTQSRTISHPDRQVFALPAFHVYASNDFDGARLSNVKHVNDTVVELDIRPENTPINSSPYYAFKSWSDADTSLYFAFHYPMGYRHRYMPKMKRKEGSWFVADSANIIVRDSIVYLKVVVPRDTLLIAAQEIHSSTDVEHWYTDLVKGKEEYVQVRSAGKSVLGKNIPVLDICWTDKKNKDIIVLLTRQHPPEVTGYLAFQIFLETLLNNSTLSKEFLNKYRVLAFPIMNPDGVDMGHWRHNAGGVDLNRDWSYYRQPEVRHAVKIIERAVKKDGGRVILGLDFHSTWHDVFYTNPQQEDIILPHFIQDWFTRLEANIPNYKVHEKSAESKQPVSKGWFLKRFNATAITYEIGDATPRDRIDLMGKVSAVEMMNILLNKPKLF